MINKTEYIDFFYNLLLAYGIIGFGAEKENYRDSMYKMLFGSDSKKQKSIRNTLAEVGIILRNDDNLDTFLFYVSYYAFIRTDRDFLFSESSDIYPNRNLGYHLKMKDRILCWMGEQFLLLYDVYMKITQEYNNWDIIIEFFFQLLFSAQYMEKNPLSSENFESLMKMGEIYDQAFNDRYMGELEFIAVKERETLQQLLIEDIVALHTSVTELFKSYFENIDILKRDDERDNARDEIDCIFFDLFFASKCWKRIYDLINLDFIEISDESKKLLESVEIVLQSSKEKLKEYFVVYIRYMKENTFLIVGSYFIIFEELREHSAQIEQLEILRKKISEGCVHNETAKCVWKCDYVNYDLDSIPVKDILDYFIPNENERKESDRNTIKTRIKTIKEVLRYVIISPNFWDIREIKMLYREFYIERNGLLGSLKYSTFLKVLEEQDTTKINYLYLVRLKEVYVALKYLSNNEKQEYIQYNLHKQKYLKSFMKEIFIEPFGIPEE